VNRVKRLVDLGSPLQQPLSVRLERFPMTLLVIDEVYDPLHAHCFPLASVVIPKLVSACPVHHWVGCQSDGTHIQAEPLGFGAWQPSQPLGLYAGTCIESRGTFFFGLRVDIRPRPFNDSVKRPSDVSGFATALAKIVL
jgi:hypothetical protein